VDALYRIFGSNVIDRPRLRGTLKKIGSRKRSPRAIELRLHALAYRHASESIYEIS
jgi:hypothetical protein